MSLRVGVIGGSIAGLSVAAALTRDGIDVEVFERAPRERRSAGAGLSVDRTLLATVTGDRVAARLPVLRLGERIVDAPEGVGARPMELEVTSWHLLRAGLASAVPQLEEEREVVDCREGWVHFAGGARRGPYDLVVFADGGDSIGRRHVGAHEAPVYAGYTLARGFLAEAELSPRAHALFFERLALRLVVRPGAHFVGYPVPGEHGEIAPGARRLNWGIYLPWADAPPREPGASERARLVSALEGWPLEIRELVERTLDLDGVTLHAVREPVSSRMVSGRVCLAGDAAHLASPITGSGARMAMEDGVVLAATLRASGDAVDDALARYERARAQSTEAIVRSASGFGAELARSARGRRSLRDPSR